jgi:hypothetical protein
MMEVDEPAIPEAAEHQSPERSVRLERIEFGLQLVRRKVVGDLGCEAAHRVQIAPDRRVNPEQLLEERLSDRARGQFVGHAASRWGMP